VEESSAEFKEPQEQKSPLAKDITAWISQGSRVTDLEVQVATTQGHIESESRNGTEADKKGSVVISTNIDDIALGKTTADMEELEAGLEDAKRQRDDAMMQRETVQRDLQTVKDDAKKLQQKHNKLIVQLQHSEELIAARNVREPNLPAFEAVEAENKRLQVAVDKTRLELNNANACCENLDDQLRNAQEKLNSQETSIKELCEIVDLVSQSMSQGVDIPVPQSEELSQSLVQASEIERLRIKIAQLIGGYGKDFKKWQEKNEELERQIADQGSEISRLEKTMDIQRRELLHPDLQSPMFPQAMQMDRDEFQQYYESERLKRKGAEQELAKAKKLLSHIHPENEKLQSDLTNAQEELADLRSKAEKLEQDVKGWKQDSEEKNSQLEERTRAFEASTDQQNQETLRYIKEYHKKTKDETYWDVQGLQKKLAALDEERIGLKRAFKQAKMDIARLGDYVTRLRKRNKARDAHIGNVQQAFMRGEEFPTLESDDDTSSSTSASTILSLTHPLDRVNRPPHIPRCHLPTAIGARNAVIATYHQELEELREQELFIVIVKPPVSTKNKNGIAYNEIMERVREWKMGSSYSPRKLGWGELRRKSPWERWDGETWAKEFATGKDVDVLKERGLWHETWV
jgi:chromosome segregation ATPase